MGAWNNKAHTERGGMRHQGAGQRGEDGKED